MKRVENSTISIELVDSLEKAREITDTMRHACYHYMQRGWKLYKIMDLAENEKEVAGSDKMIEYISNLPPDLFFQYTLGLCNKGYARLLVGANNSKVPDAVKLEVQAWCKLNEVKISVEPFEYGTLCTTEQQASYNSICDELNTRPELHGKEFDIRTISSFLIDTPKEDCNVDNLLKYIKS